MANDDVIERAEALLMEPIANRMGAGERACQLVIDLVVALRSAREDTRRMERRLMQFEYFAMMVVDGQLTETEKERSLYRRGFRGLLDAAIASEEG